MISPISTGSVSTTALQNVTTVSGGHQLSCLTWTLPDLWPGEVRLREVSQCLLFWSWNRNVLSSELHFHMVS